MKDLVIIGSKNFAKEVLCLIEDINKKNNQYNILGFVDNNYDSETIIGDYSLIGDDEWLESYSSEYDIYGVIAIGDGNLREKIRYKFKHVKWETIIHPSAIVSKYNKIGVGNIICAGVVITSHIDIGDFNLFNLNTTVGHDTVIGDYNSFMPSVNISGNVRIENNVYCGTNSCIIPMTRVNSFSVVGAGAVVIRDVNSYSTVVGNPAKAIK